jgi:predicted DNA-binding transcriptional regulator YafY
VKLNYELEQAILSYGDGLEVLAPKVLRDKLRKRIENLLTIYNTPKPKL